MSATGKKRPRPGALVEIRRVLDCEAAALRRARRAVDGSYAAAVEILAACRGTVILTGVGKSGAIAQKIAATLTSTGTPAVCLDPTEALHGGVGLVQPRDVVLALGKSGESDELNALLPHLRARGAKLIALTANPKSTLARRADVVLHTPVAEEACPLNLAPTSSTTVALAVGDALAVALMKRRGFGAGDFAANHPGGRLGRRLNLTVADVMRSGEDNPVVRADAGVRRLLVEITRRQAGAASVVDGRGRFLGLVTDYDLRRALERGRDPLALSIRAVMNPRPTVIRPEESAAKAVAVMENRRNPFNVLPVVDRRGRAVGLVQVHDLRARGL
ncbi:MAG: KpsF/GutQ family sugar-phosphate isomerase [Elusimicrobia bacterium]|nr:KpsF/GutQ family sugar-phosphate isomerase [Elusimicrobiota bacterium]